MVDIDRSYTQPMCRNIRVLFHFQPPTTDDEIRAAELQYVRKVSGTTKPSRANAPAFEAAVEQIAKLTRKLILEGLVPAGPPRTREREAAAAKERGRKRAFAEGEVREIQAGTGPKKESTPSTPPQTISCRSPSDC